MRQLGIGVLGLFSGLLLGLLVMEVVSRAAVANGTDIGGSLPLSLFLGFVAPVLAVVGVVVSLLIDRRVRQKQ